MDILIFIIIIAVVFTKARKNNAKKRPSTVRAVNRNTQKARNQQAKEQQARMQQFQMQQAKQKQEIYKQQELKLRLEEKYNKTSGKSQNAILERAKGNISEQNIDESTLMHTVYDLMITGYNGSVEFERDFLAEGMDMLNRIQG